MLVNVIEQSLPSQLLLELVKRSLESTASGGFEDIYKQLILAARLIGPHATTRTERFTVAGSEAKILGLIAKTNGRDLRVIVLEGEIYVPGRRAPKVRHLSFNPNV